MECRHPLFPLHRHPSPTPTNVHHCKRSMKTVNSRSFRPRHPSIMILRQRRERRSWRRREWSGAGIPSSPLPLPLPPPAVVPPSHPWYPCLVESPRRPGGTVGRTVMVEEEDSMHHHPATPWTSASRISNGGPRMLICFVSSLPTDES